MKTKIPQFDAAAALAMTETTNKFEECPEPMRKEILNRIKYAASNGEYSLVYKVKNSYVEGTKVWLTGLKFRLDVVKLDTGFSELTLQWKPLPKVDPTKDATGVLESGK